MIITIINSSHRFILAGDNKGVTYPWIMLDGSGTTLHYNGSEDACKACNNKFAVFGMLQLYITFFFFFFFFLFYQYIILYV